jgi:prolyl 4-hydroxylase
MVRCIEDRALSFQGFDRPRKHLESLQLVKYNRGGTYHWHTDWFISPSQTTVAHGGNRISTFFVYVAASNVTGGGTNFPKLDAPRDERWCQFVDCDESLDRGVTFRPVVGNAVFWLNLGEDGRGDERVLHAGLPITSGEKLGMNIWTREDSMSEEFRGFDEEA